MDLFIKIQDFFMPLPQKKLFQDFTTPPTNASIINPISKQEYVPKNTHKITYNYYDMFSTKVQTPFTGYVHYTMNGRENDPNLTIDVANSESTNYVSKNLYIFSKIHDLPNMPRFDAELVIENTPISKSHKPVLFCIPLKTDQMVAPNIINHLLEDTTDENAIIQNKNIDIQLNTLLSSNKPAYYYETPEYKIVVFLNPIKISANFVGLSKEHIPTILDELFLQPPENSIIVNVANSREPFAKKFTVVDSQEIPNFWITNNTVKKEGFDARDPSGNLMWMECDNVDVDYENQIPTYTIPAGSDKITLKEKTLNYAISLVWLLAIVVVVVFVTPILFSILAVRSFKSGDVRSVQLTNINSAEAVFSFLFFIPAIILISVGSSKSIKCPDDDKECIKSANELVLPGTILLGIWVFFLGSLSWNKYANPNFLGYRDPEQKVPYFTYTPSDIGLGHLFNPLAFTVLGNLVTG